MNNFTNIMACLVIIAFFFATSYALVFSFSAFRLAMASASLACAASFARMRRRRGDEEPKEGLNTTPQSFPAKLKCESERRGKAKQNSLQEGNEGKYLGLLLRCASLPCRG